MINRPCKLSASHLTFKYLYLSDLSILPNNIPDVLVPPGFFAALFWIALVFYFLGVVSVYVSSIFTFADRFEKYNLRTWAKIVTHVTFLIGMRNLYLLGEGLGLLNSHHLGFAIWLVVLVFYRKAAADFNACLLIQGAQAPALVAHLGNAFFRESIHQRKPFDSIQFVSRSDRTGLRLLRWFICHNA